ncbi:MAG TPA: nucleotidyltransferase family protein [Candidatus Acidoferrales bacterium]|nr:nucleotidyltransferase family protein [Candidatus Acidoferrales bacterium]
MSGAAVILAAGESRRMGFPKALLQYRGATFLDVLIGLLGARCSPVIVVVGAYADRVREGATRPATFVTNGDFQLGMTSSLQCGLRAVPADADGVLFTLVDHPAVAPATIDALLAQTATLVRVPCYRGQRGHPVWFSRALIPEFLALPETGAARDVVRAHAADTTFLDLDDPGITADIDDPAAYRELTGAVL